MWYQKGTFSRFSIILNLDFKKEYLPLQRKNQDYGQTCWQRTRNK